MTKTMIKKNFTYLNLLFALLLNYSCSESYKTQQDVASQAAIYPDYYDVTIPRTISPLNFTVTDSADIYLFNFNDSNGKSLFSIKSKSGDSDIPFNKWKEAIADNSIDYLNVEISVIRDGVKYNYEPMRINISNDAIDSHIAYRLINPGYVYWGKMGIYQRDITSFNETSIIINDETDNGCMNCHTFHQNSPDRFLFHLRQYYAGTVISINGRTERFDMKTGSMMGQTVYPAWHPGGRYIAFSTNVTRQIMHLTGDKPIEVFDSNSDIVIYDTQKSILFSDELIYDPMMAESFPTWSNDGKYLYFVSTKRNEDNMIEPLSLKYNLYRVAFDAETETFSDYELIFDASVLDMSVAIPRTFHDGEKVSFSMSNYGTFSIWHKEADLYSIDLNTRQLENLEILNSDESESYRGFSSNGNWVVFTSRRDDGLYSNLYIAHYSKESGEFSKPFMLPQKNAEYNYLNERSYNVPEFITGEVDRNLLKDVKEGIALPIENGKGI